MKTLIDGVAADPDMRSWVDGDHLTFPCGCRFRILKDRPEVFGLPALSYDHKGISLNCAATWATIGTGLTKGIFQLESRFARPWAKKLRPDTIEHLSGLLSVLRPGCLQARTETGVSVTDAYILRRHGREDISYPIEAVRAILEETFGLMIYQEQMMKIAQVVANFDLVEVDALRGAVGKKQMDKLAKVGELFIDKADTHGVITRAEAETLFDNIKKSGRYLFNKCISFDTIIRRPGGGKKLPLTVEEMFKIRNDIGYAKATNHLPLYKKWKFIKSYGYGLSRDKDGRIRQNIIKDIQPAGVRRVYKVTTTCGRTIRATANHKFPDPGTGREILLADMAPGYPIYICGQFERQDISGKGASFTRLDSPRYRPLATKGTPDSIPGQGRWPHANGSCTSFIRFKESTPNVCAECGKTSDEATIEAHHKDGNRENGDWSNFVKLCSSHHKKAEYALGRTRKGQKGYPTLVGEIASIEPDGECMTYDVTMEGPNHTFVTSSDILTCNSHSLSYAFLTYRSAYEKTHWPLQFYTAALFWAKEKGNKREAEMAELIQEAARFGIKVGPPVFHELRDHFGTPDGETISFGLADIKGIGDSLVATLPAKVEAAEATAGPLGGWSWYTFLTAFSLSAGKAVVRKVIESGGLRHLDPRRQRLLAELEAWAKLTDREREVVLGLAEPIPLLQPVTQAVEERSYTPRARKAHKAWMEQGGEGPEPQPDKVAAKVVPVLDAEGKPTYEVARGDDGKPVDLDPARPCDNLADALRGLLARVVARTAKGEPRFAYTKARGPIIADLIQGLDNPAVAATDDAYWVAEVEQQHLGIALTSSQVESTDRSRANCRVEDYLAGDHPETVRLACNVRAVRDWDVRSGTLAGRRMAKLEVDDETGVLDDVVVFPDAWFNLKSLLGRAGSLVLLEGQRSRKDDSSSLIVDRAWRLAS